MIRYQRRQIIPKSHPQQNYPAIVRSVTMESLQLCSISDPPPLAYPGMVTSFEGPFQIIEPGSEFYVQTDPDFFLEPTEIIQLPQDLNLSDNGIPLEVLDEVFCLEDELEASGISLPTERPVPNGVSLEQYETHLVAEMERLFPDVGSTLPVKDVAISGPGVDSVAVTQESRLMEELIRKYPSENPCYMDVVLPEDAALPESDRSVSVKKRKTFPS